MTAILRVVLDQAVAPTDPDLERASVHLARALVDAAPKNAAVAGIAPSGDSGLERITGLVDVWRTPLSRTKLLASWQLGVPLGVGGGLIHSPTLVAPLVRHDRAHDHDQTVVTLWSLDPWRHPERLPRAQVAAQRALLKRAVRHADALVVPSHAFADDLDSIAHFADRIRVIGGAASPTFCEPTDAAARRRDLDIAGEYAAIGAGRGDTTVALQAVARNPDLGVVLVDVPESAEAEVREIASAAGIPEHRLRLPDLSDDGDRAAVLAGAVAFLAPSTSTAFAWRVLEALTVGTPVVAAATSAHTELLADGGQLVTAGDVDAFAGALERIMADTELRTRLSVLAADRAKAFSWRDHAERVWALHADL